MNQQAVVIGTFFTFVVAVILGIGFAIGWTAKTIKLTTEQNIAKCMDDRKYDLHTERRKFYYEGYCTGIFGGDTNPPDSPAL